MTSPVRVPVFDGHNDTLLHMHFLPPESEWSFLSRNDTGHIDLPRAREGGMWGGFFAILPPRALSGEDKLGRAGLVRTAQGYEIPMAEAVSFEYARDFTFQVMARLFRLERDSCGQFQVARSFADLQRAQAQETMAAILHFEGAEAIDPDLDLLEVYYQAGLRSLGIVWSRPTAFGYGVPFRFPSSPDTGPGLTEAGRRLVSACNKLGIMLDLAHLNEAGFWDVAQRSQHPLVVTHACCHAICPSARNLTDRQLDAIGESGGVVGINFFVGDLRRDGTFDQNTPLTQIVEHIRYVADRIGVDHVAFGSDFDGARVPTELGDASGFQRLIEALRHGGFSEDEIARIASDNWLRVLRSTWHPPPTP